MILNTLHFSKKNAYIILLFIAFISLYSSPGQCQEALDKNPEDKNNIELPENNTEIIQKQTLDQKNLPLTWSIPEKIVFYRYGTLEQNLPQAEDPEQGKITYKCTSQENDSRDPPYIIEGNCLKIKQKNPLPENASGDYEIILSAEDSYRNAIQKKIIVSFKENTRPTWDIEKFPEYSYGTPYSYTLPEGNDADNDSLKYECSFPDFSGITLESGKISGIPKIDYTLIVKCTLDDGKSIPQEWYIPFSPKTEKSESQKINS